MQGQAEQAKEGTSANLLQGLGLLSLEQLQSLGEQIKLACRPLEQNQQAWTGPTQGKGGGGTITPTQSGGGAKGSERPRSRSPTPKGTNQTEEEIYTARDLGLEGAQGQQFDLEQQKHQQQP